MELNTMSFEELEARKAAIATECEAEGADLDALLEESRAINAEIEARKAAEAKKAELRSAVAAGAGTVIETAEAEERKDTKMDLAEIRKSEAYINAYANYIRTGNADECDAIKVYPISPVGVEKAVAVRIGAEIEGKRPRAPEKIDVAVADAAVSEINKAAELPVVQKDVRQTIIPV